AAPMRATVDLPAPDTPTTDMRAIDWAVSRSPLSYFGPCGRVTTPLSQAKTGKGLGDCRRENGTFNIVPEGQVPPFGPRRFPRGRGERRSGNVPRWGRKRCVIERWS